MPCKNVNKSARTRCSRSSFNSDSGSLTKSYHSERKCAMRQSPELIVNRGPCGEIPVASQRRPEVKERLPSRDHRGRLRERSPRSLVSCSARWNAANSELTTRGIRRSECAEIPKSEGQPGNHCRLFLHFENASGQDPQRVPPNIVSLFSVVKPDHKAGVVPRPQFAVMETNLLGESSRFPTMHSRGRHSDPIDGPALTGT